MTRTALTVAAVLVLCAVARAQTTYVPEPGTHCAGKLCTVNVLLDNQQWSATYRTGIYPPADWTQIPVGPYVSDVAVHSLYLAIPRSSQYSVVVYPKRPGIRYAIGIAVDGLCVLTGKPVTHNYARADAWPRRHIVYQGAPNQIRGWRENAQTVRRFVATESHRSLAAAWGSTSDRIGTIVVAIFESNDTWRPSGYVFRGSGTGADNREWCPVRVEDFDGAPVASELYLLRYATPAQLGTVRQPRDAGFIGPLPRIK